MSERVNIPGDGLTCTCSGCDQTHLDGCPVCGGRRVTFGRKHYDRLMVAIRRVEEDVTNADVLFDPSRTNIEEQDKRERARLALAELSLAARFDWR